MGTTPVKLESYVGGFARGAKVIELNTRYPNRKHRTFKVTVASIYSDILRDPNKWPLVCK